MASYISRPALTGNFAVTLEAVAQQQNISTAGVIRQLMIKAWGPNLENAPTHQSQDQNQDQDQSQSQNQSQNQAKPQIEADQLFRHQA